MFRIKEIIMANFARFAGVSIPLDGETSVFTGPNGSGKSTTFDAARLVLGSRKLASEKREISEYLRQPNTFTILAIIASNRRKDGKPAIFRRLALKEEWITLARVYVPKSQSYESKFLINDGALTSDEILDRIEKGDGLGEQRYKDKLATIGITPATLDQIIIRQGKVIEVTNGGAKKLHERIMGHAGASETMTEYRTARQGAEDAARKLRELEDEHRKTLRQLDELETALRYKQKFDEKKAEIADFKAIEQVAIIHSDLLKLKKRQDDIPELEEAITSLTEERATLRAGMEAAARTVEEGTQILADWDNETLDISEDKRRTEDKRGALDPTHARYVLAKDAIPTMSGLPATGEAEVARSEAIEREYAARNEVDAAQAASSTANSRLEALKAGRTAWPEVVRQTLEAFEAANITFKCLAHTLDPDHSSKPLLEAALGTRKYAIEVDKPHLTRALTLAAKHQFPGPINTPTTAGLQHDEAKLWNGIGMLPAWLGGFSIQGQRVISPEGAWVSTDNHTVLGPEPSPTEVAEALVEKNECDRAFTTAAATLRDARAHLQNVLDTYAECKTRDEYVLIIDAAGSMPDVFATLVAKEQRLAIALDERASTKERITKDREEARKQHRSLKDTDQRRESRLRDKESALSNSTEEIAELTKKTERALILLSDEWKQRARDLSETYRPPDVYRKRAAEVERELATMKEPDPDIERQALRFRMRVREFKERVEDQQSTVQGTLGELDRARRQYAVFGTQHLEEYKKRFLTLATDFNVKATVSFTPIRHDSTDAEIDNAILEVRVGFNGKEPTLVSGGGFSGGEEILNGLMLQLAMRDVDIDGFIMVDQPYDHLDSMNAREVAQHLANARMQVIIAVPSSLSPEHYHGMARGVLFQKAQGDGWAPLPEVVAVRGT